MLVGSCANGFGLSNSDVDILVVINKQDLISQIDEAVFKFFDN